MALSCGLVGLPSVGKTTFFDLLTGWGADARTRPSGKAGVSSGHARIPDGRVDYLSAMFKPKKTTYAQMEVTDVPWIKGGGPEFVAALGACDALAHIVRAFRGVGGADGEPDPMAELRELDAETLLSDIMSAEARMGRIRSGGKKKAESEGEEAALERCLTTLNEGRPLTEANMAEDDADALRHMRFLSGKPYVVVANLGEDGLRTGSWPQKALVEGYCAERGVTLLEVSAGLEEEIGRLPEGERAAFMEDLGLTESGVGRMAKALYAQLRLASFLTVGEDEVKAWTVKAGTPARQAAGKVHTDIERGFIRAETIAFDRLKEAGSMASARERGHFRLEGKDYAVKDGDVINFRFNV